MPVSSISPSFILQLSRYNSYDFTPFVFYACFIDLCVGDLFFSF